LVSYLSKTRKDDGKELLLCIPTLAVCVVKKRRREKGIKKMPFGEDISLGVFFSVAISCLKKNNEQCQDEKSCGLRPLLLLKMKVRARDEDENENENKRKKEGTKGECETDSENQSGGKSSNQAKPQRYTDICSHK
jgi:hypothetical protein